MGMPWFESLYRGESWCWFWYLILLAPRGCQSLAWWFDLLRSGLSRSFGSFGQDNRRGLRLLSFFSLFLLIVGSLAVECCFCWFHGLLHWNRTAESEQIGEAAHRAVEIGAWKFIMEQKSRILARLDFRSARAYLIANVLCSRYMSAFSTSLSSINTWYDTMSRIQLINEFYSIESAQLCTYTRKCTVLKVDGTTPKGGLARGHEKPIHGSCAIFPGGSCKHAWKDSVNIPVPGKKISAISRRQNLWPMLDRGNAPVGQLRKVKHHAIGVELATKN